MVFGNEVGARRRFRRALMDRAVCAGCDYSARVWAAARVDTRHTHGLNRVAAGVGVRGNLEFDDALEKETGLEEMEVGKEAAMDREELDKESSPSPNGF